LVDVELEVLGVLGGGRLGVGQVGLGVVDVVLAGGGPGLQGVLGPADRVGGLGQVGLGIADVGVVQGLLARGSGLEELVDLLLGRLVVGLGGGQLVLGVVVVDGGQLVLDGHVAGGVHAGEDDAA